MLTGINHITISVTNLVVSFDFYTTILGMKPEVKWDAGAYLSVGDLWVCLALERAVPSKDYSHIGFSIREQDFEEYCSMLVSLGIEEWKDNSSEGVSLYILDPDGHKLEVHVGNLNSRLRDLKKKPYKGLQWF
mgnify:CR=1 FL=1